MYRGIEILYQKDPRYFKGNVNYNVVMYNGINRKLLESLEYLWKSDVTLIDLFETEYFKKSRDKSDEESVDEKIDEKNFDIVYRNLLLNMKKYQNAFNESDVNKTIFPGGFCVPGVRKNFITADGKIIICEKVDERQELFRIGDIYNGIDMERVNKLMNETEKRLSKCKYCWAARFCNICFMDVLSMKQEYCDQSKENIEKELGYYISRISPDRELVNYIANGKLNNIEESLKQSKVPFLRVHQSYLVNYKHVEGQAYDFVVMDNGKRISISEDRRKLIGEQYCSMEDTFYVNE